ncbi:hypothetical protein TcWFU_007996 [Taenia crassiceps]|uniref:Uncharacterized protein n=1 Tax=Taenia crassiceps TaxID=6207 RepID=A0ABR4QSF3_9CEST
MQGVRSTPDLIGVIEAAAFENAFSNPSHCGLETIHTKCESGINITVSLFFEFRPQISVLPRRTVEGTHPPTWLSHGDWKTRPHSRVGHVSHLADRGIFDYGRLVCTSDANDWDPGHQFYSGASKWTGERAGMQRVGEQDIDSQQSR